MKSIIQTAKTGTCFTDWKNIYDFITTAKNYESHALAPNGDLLINDKYVFKLGDTIKKKHKKLIFD